jgi:predicted ATPase/DNA-binding winged helix-turn-helix (wHTH) protein
MNGLRLEDRRSVYEAGVWHIDLARRELRSGGAVIPIGGRAFGILEVLVRSAGQLVTKEDLIARVWSGADVADNTLQANVSAIRKALGPDRHMLKTSSRRGYYLVGGWIQRPDSAPQAAAACETQPPTSSFVTDFPVASFDLIGRTVAEKRVRDLVMAYRAVTLTGPGGIGKTMLARAAAQNLLPDFEGDGRFVELVSVSNSALVPSAVASAIGLKSGGDRISSESVAQAIGDRKLLILLDNCEHVIDAAAELVGTIMRICPHVTVLSTSREMLRIGGEGVYHVPPLDVPPRHQTASDDILKHSAVQLFISRMALSCVPSPGEVNLQTVASICRRLDGIPLAIEFAAARTASLGLREVAARLDDRFGLLTSGRRTALPRHQTLRATLDWSCGLLAESERRLLYRVAVFPGGFTLDGAIRVMSSAHDTSFAVLEGISSLVAKSLLTLDGSVFGGRWRMLETVQAYALEKLAESGEAELVARRHAEFFRDLLAPASGASPPSNGRLVTTTTEESATQKMAHHRREIDNVRAALQWSFSPAGEPTIGIVLAAAYAPVWLSLDLLLEFCGHAERALERPELDASLTPQLQIQLLLSLGFASFIAMRQIEPLRAVFARVLAVAEREDDLDGQLGALWGNFLIDTVNSEAPAALKAAEDFADLALRSNKLAVALFGDRLVGSALLYTGDLRGAEHHLGRVVELYPVTNPGGSFLLIYDHRLLARAIRTRVLWLRGSVDQAVNEAEVSCRDAQVSGHKLSLCWAIYYAAYPIALFTGDLSGAERAVVRLTELATSLNSAFWKVVRRYMEGRLLIERGECEKGLDLLRAALGTCDRTGWKIYFPEFLGAVAEGLAGLDRLTEAMATIDQALTIAHRGGERWYVSELLRLKGEFLLQINSDAGAAAAEDCFELAIRTAGHQGAVSWQLRSALSLARLRVRQNRLEEACHSLMALYEEFDEGLETRDLRAARALLETLSSRAR